MSDFVIENGNLRKCTNAVGDVAVPNGVISISCWAFVDNTNMTSISIPASVTTISIDPFARCTSLNAIYVDPDNLEYCEKDGVLFSKDGKILCVYPSGRTGSYTIPDGVTEIGEEAFSECTELTSILIPASVTTIGRGVFHGCAKLTSVSILSSLTEISDNAFAGCWALTSISIPSSVTEIGSEAFAGCKALTSISIPANVTHIYYGAFSFCTNLTSISIPASVTQIDWDVFEDCTSLSAIHVHPDNPKYSETDGVLFTKDKKTLHAYPSGRTGPYTIPDSVTEIEDTAFSRYNSLTSITIPNSVTTIPRCTFADDEKITIHAPTGSCAEQYAKKYKIRIEAI